MIEWADQRLIFKGQLADEGPPLQGTLGVEIGDVSNDQVPAIEGQGIALVQTPLKVRITTRQCL